MKTHLISIVIACVVALSGCAANRLQHERANLAGQPEPYKDGYVDGCSSGTKAAGNPYYSFMKNPIRFENDKLYAQGWTDGFNICKGQYDSIGNALRK